MIDSHCHLDFPDFDSDRSDLIDQAHQTGVHTIINIGIDLATSKRSIELAEEYESVYATVGFHPHEAKNFSERSVEDLKELARHKKVVGLGEIGLDYYRDRSPRQTQREVFARQLQLAVELALPVVIHTREAFDDSLAIVSDFSSGLAGGTFHCFPGSAAEAEKVLALGLLVSVGGVLTYKNSSMAQMAAATPLEKILLETDAPFLTPHPNRGKRNSPAQVRFVAEKLAELKQTTFDEVERVTDKTCRKLFRLEETFGG